MSGSITHLKLAAISLQLTWSWSEWALLDMGRKLQINKNILINKYTNESKLLTKGSGNLVSEDTAMKVMLLVHDIR